MAYRVEKDTGDLVIHGVEDGIAASPHLGIADIRNLNINSFTGEASVNFNRINTLPVVLNGTLVANASNSVTYTGTPGLIVGNQITTGASTISGLSSSTKYWVILVSGSVGSQTIQLSATYGGATATGFGLSGSAAFNTFTFTKFVQSATEYIASQNAYRYYLMDTRGIVWVNDVNVYGVFSPSGGPPTTISNTDASGFAVSQGVAFVFFENQIWFNFTESIGGNWTVLTTNLNTPVGNTTASHYAITTPDQNGSIYYCDSQFLGQITGAQSQFSLMKVTSSSSTSLAITSYRQGVLPVIGLAVSVFAPTGGSVPVELTAGTVYYVVAFSQSGATLGLSATPGGSAISVSPGTFYVTSFYPTTTQTASLVFQALALPYFESATCLAQFSQNGLTIAVGTIGNNVYFWSPGTSAPFSVLPLPESNTHRMLNVDNTIYIFTGNKANIYLSNGSQLAGVFSVPDYIANTLGTNQDPWFIWGDVMFLRGRVWFSVQDQHAGNTTGNCGGVWSFTPTQNLFLGQDQGIQVHLENENSYGTYNGICDVLLPNQNQQVNGPQYWSTFSSDYSSPTFGIDFSGTVPYNTSQFGQIDTDIIPVGTFLKPSTSINIEYKLSRPMVSGESVAMLYRQNLTTPFIALGTGPGGAGIDNTVGALSFPFPQTLQNLQWVQFRVKLTSTVSSPSYLPFTEIRIHQT